MIGAIGNPCYQVVEDLSSLKLSINSDQKAGPLVNSHLKRPNGLNSLLIRFGDLLW